MQNIASDGKTVLDLYVMTDKSIEEFKQLLGQAHIPRYLDI